MVSIPVSEKYALTIEEAAAYFHIGEKKIRSMISCGNYSDAIMYVGSHALIKRKMLEEKLDRTVSL